MSQQILQVDQAMLETTLDRMVRKSVEETLNAMLDAEADEITGAARYERSGDRKAYRAGHYERDLTVKAGKMSLKVPKLKGAVFESAVIERYRRRGTGRRPQVQAREQRRRPPLRHDATRRCRGCRRGCRRNRGFGSRRAIRGLTEAAGTVLRRDDSSGRMPIRPEPRRFSSFFSPRRKFVGLHSFTSAAPLLYLLND